MKKIALLCALLVVLLAFTACTNTESNNDANNLTEPENNNTVAENAEESIDLPDSTAEESKSLVVYFSWSGNTENVAEEIQKQTGADIFEIVPQEAYSDDYDTVVDQAQQEQEENARPVISGSIAEIADYDIIYVGYPNWWGDMPMILYTFFDSYDLAGKTIAAFCTSGGSGLSDTINTIAALEAQATVTKGLHIGSSAADDPASAVSSWLEEINTER